jgi:hypothetical protein
MAEQRPPGSGGTSPTPERGTQGRETTPEVSTQVTETAAISGDLLSAVISTRYILGFRKDNPNVFNMLVQNLHILAA